MSNRREVDGESTLWSAWDATAGHWPHKYNMEERGIYFYGHQKSVKSTATPATNCMLDKMKHFWGNLEAYNNLAGSQVFRPMKITDMPQRLNDTFPD